MRSILMWLLVMSSTVFFLAPAAGGVTLAPGDLILTGGIAGERGMYRVDPATLVPERISEALLGDFAVTPSRTIYALAPGGIVTVDATNGETEFVVSDPRLSGVWGLAARPDDTTLYAGRWTGASNRLRQAEILEIDVLTGRISTLASGGLLDAFSEQAFLDLELSLDGNPVLNYYGDPVHGILEVDAQTGSLELTRGGGVFTRAQGLGVAPNGDIFTADSENYCGCLGRLIYETGEIDGYSIRTGFDEDGFEKTVYGGGVAVGLDGQVWITGWSQDGEGLFRQSLEQGIENNSELVIASDGFGEIQVVPVPEPTTALLFGLGLAWLGAKRRPGKLG